MSRTRRRVKLLWPLVLVVLLAAAGYGLLRQRSAMSLRARLLQGQEPAPLTPNSPAVARLRAAAHGANVVICVIDAARADHLSCYGYPRQTTPNIDRLASQSFLFENHFVQFVETKPSTASLFTGQYPDTHLARDDRKLAESTFTLARGLGEAGFHTVLFSQNEWASPLWGIGADLREAYYEPHLLAAGRERPFIWQPEALLEQIARWLNKKPPTPFFAYIHFTPPHDPYIAPPHIYSRFFGSKPPNAWRSPYPFAEVERALRRREKPWSQELFLNCYDGHLLYADWAVTELMAMLQQAGLFDNTLFILTSDHGEAFGEHGYKGHTISAYDESIHVPLVVKLPGPSAPQGRIRGLTQTIDLLPTIFDLLALPYPSRGVQGRSLLPLMAGEAEEVNQHIFARTAGNPPSYTIRDRRSMLLLYQGGKLRAFYDLKRDPRALRNVLAEQPEEAARLMAVFRSFAKRQTAPPLDFLDPKAAPPRLPKVEKVEVTEEMRRALKALGYLK